MKPFGSDRFSGSWNKESDWNDDLVLNTSKLKLLTLLEANK